MEDNWIEKINILISNISSYYAFSVVISVIAVAFSLWYNKRCRDKIAYLKSKNMEESQENKETIDSEESCSDNDLVDREEDDVESEEEDSQLDEEIKGSEDVQARFKSARYQAMVDHLSSKMTPEQKMQEIKTEKAQLEAIFNLLKEQKDKFQVSEMSDLEEQLSLYR